MDDFATDVQTCIDNSDKRGVFLFFALLLSGFVAYVLSHLLP